jgi:hypothetical protein
MAGYHINPTTGEPGLCKAKVSCPFGDLEDDHYTSREAAAAAYEKTMATFASTVKSVNGTDQDVEVPKELKPLVSAVIKNSGNVMEIFDHSGKQAELIVTRYTDGGVRALYGEDFDETFGGEKAKQFANALAHPRLIGHPIVRPDKLSPDAVSVGSLQQITNFEATAEYSFDDAIVLFEEDDEVLHITGVEATAQGAVLLLSEPSEATTPFIVAELSSEISKVASKLSSPTGELPVSLRSALGGTYSPLTLAEIMPARGLVLRSNHL